MIDDTKPVDNTYTVENIVDNTLVISTPPHVRKKRNTKGIMGDVCIALAPAAIAGIVFFGYMAFIIELVAVLGCVATEFVYFFIAKGGFANKCKNAGLTCKLWWKQFALTSIVTGLILALILPVTVQWYEVLIGSIFAIAIVKMFFGGTGKNLVNPAATARVLMLLSFSMTVYVAANVGAVQGGGEVLTSATNLNHLLNESHLSQLSVLDLFLGTGVNGCIGETSALAILIGYIYLCVRKVIKWWQPLLLLAVFGFCAVLLSGFYFDKYKFDIGLFLPHVLSGGAVFAAVFMFTDYVTSPKGVIGQLVYYIAGGILLALLRYLTGLEVASFIILIMNILVPLIDRYCIRKPFGYVKEKKHKEGK